MGRPKLELNHVEKALGFQIRPNTELEGRRKAKLEGVILGVQNFGFSQKLMRFCKYILPAALEIGRPNLELDHVEEGSGYQMRLDTELEKCQKIKSDEFEFEGANFGFCRKMIFFVKEFCWQRWYSGLCGKLLG